MLDAVLVDVHWHVLAIFVLWSATFVTALVRFRERTHPTPRAKTAGAFWPALAIAAVITGNAVLLGARALPAWRARMTTPPSGAALLEVRITSEQFAWNIHYPGPDGRLGRSDASLISASNPIGIDRTDPAAADDIGLQNVLMLPLDRPVLIHLTSRDVVHGFTLPEMRVQHDATPGMTTTTWFTPTKAGQWQIVCSQLCGLGHYRMHGAYRVLPQEDWNRWLAGEVKRARL
jgi:cytochrome c oxidase subunit 2